MVVERTPHRLLRHVHARRVQRHAVVHHPRFAVVQLRARQRLFLAGTQESRTAIEPVLSDMRPPWFEEAIQAGCSGSSRAGAALEESAGASSGRELLDLRWRSITSRRLGNEDRRSKAVCTETRLRVFGRCSRRKHGWATIIRGKRSPHSRAGTHLPSTVGIGSPGCIVSHMPGSACDTASREDDSRCTGYQHDSRNARQ